MCGIAGLFHPRVPKPVDPARIEAMVEVLSHRGPDGSGVWTAPGIGLGHRRLSVVDLSENAAQPMLTADRRVAVSFDGMIYNFRELRTELETKGHVFRSDSDTEVILAAWRQWGPECLSRLNGMFAFALYDAAEDCLFLARDRLGVKPLLYAQLSDGALVFASELKGLLAHPMLRRGPRAKAVEDYLALGYVPDDASIVDGVKKLPAGHCLLVRRGRNMPHSSTWWDVDFCNPSRSSAAALEEELGDLLREAVRSRMVADVPFGAFLSGGTGSSAVVAFMAELSRGAVHTCSIRFDDGDNDESGFAALVAERFATDHRVRTVSNSDLSLIDALVGAFDEPFADPLALPQLQLNALAREKVKVALSGDGADDIFAGHGRYRMFRNEERMRGVVPGPLSRVLGTFGDLSQKFDRGLFYPRARRTLQALGRESAEAYALSVAVTPLSIRSTLYTKELRRGLGGHSGEERYAQVMRDAPAGDALSRAQYVDLKIGLPGAVLTRMDRASMAVGLEAREPLLDHRLVEFAARLPARMRLRGGTGKWLMRRALRDRLPEQILAHRTIGLATPLSAWFRGPLAAEAAGLARGSALAQTGWFDSAAIAQLAEQHRLGRFDHGRLLWQLLILERSLQHLFGLGAVKRRDTPPQRSRAHRAAR